MKTFTSRGLTLIILCFLSMIGIFTIQPESRTCYINESINSLIISVSRNQTPLTKALISGQKRGDRREKAGKKRRLFREIKSAFRKKKNQKYLSRFLFDVIIYSIVGLLAFSSFLIICSLFYPFGIFILSWGIGKILLFLAGALLLAFLGLIYTDDKWGF